MTATVECAPVELDLLATHAGARFPFPLRVPSFGRLAAERDALLAAAGHALRDRGLATEHGPLGMANELVTALREYRGAVDVVVVGPTVVRGAVAMVYGSWAVVCHQTLSDTEPGTVRVVRVPATALTDELATLIPPARPAPELPVTLPPAVDQLATLVAAPAGRGQLGAVRRAGATVRRVREVSWLDSPRGRVRVDRGSDGWVSVNPVRHNELVRALGEVAAVARG